MALLALDTPNEPTVGLGGGSWYIPPSFPVLKYPDAPTVVPSVPNGGDDGCNGCKKKPTVIPSVPGGGATPIPLPPPIVTPNPGDGVPKNAAPTYTQLAASVAVGDTATTGDAMGNDWWKYLVGAAVGYLIAKR